MPYTTCHARKRHRHMCRIFFLGSHCKHLLGPCTSHSTPFAERLALSVQRGASWLRSVNRRAACWCQARPHDSRCERIERASALSAAPSALAEERVSRSRLVRGAAPGVASQWCAIRTWGAGLYLLFIYFLFLAKNAEFFAPSSILFGRLPRSKSPLMLMRQIAHIWAI